MNKQNLSRFKQVLLTRKQEQERLIGEMWDNGLGESLTDSISEFAAYDNHPGDIAAETFERSKDLSLRENSKRVLGDIEHALERIENGTYGTCERCGKEIEPARLSVMPQASLCSSCGLEETHVVTHRPVEEEAHQVFTGIFEDQPDSVMYDGEDAWQDVERYGSSNAVGDIPGAKGFQDAFHNSREQIGFVWPEEKTGLSYDRSKRKHITGGS